MEKMFLATVLCVSLAAFGFGCSSPSSSASQPSGEAGNAHAALESAPVPCLYRQISQEQAQAMMDGETGYVILDVRRLDEFSSGHIPGALNIPVEEISDVPPAELPDKEQLVMVYCRSGNRSKAAAQKLADMGYSNVVEFGGINTWPGDVVAD